MFFCPNCDNSYDITRNIEQTGGGAYSESSETISYELSGGKSEYSELVKKILNNVQLSELEIKNINMGKLISDPFYKKLKSTDKQYIYNKIQDSLPIEKKKLLKEKTKLDSKKLAFFVCNNCGFVESIKDGTLIFSRTSQTKSQFYSDNYHDLVNSNILPRTRKYICSNKKCDSYKDPNKREAIMFRLSNSYQIKYICLACKSIF